MHIKIIDELNMIIYLNKFKLGNIDFNKREDLQDYFKNLFFNLKVYYNIDVNGFYNINVFKDRFYGIVLEIEKEDLDYMEYFNGSIDMNISIQSQNFLYEIDDYFNIDKKILDKIKIYQYKNKLYLEIIEELSNINMAKICEFSKIIYQDNVNTIIKHGKKIDVKHLLVK